jgi:hypothetical protein
VLKSLLTKILILTIEIAYPHQSMEIRTKFFCSGKYDTAEIRPKVQQVISLVNINNEEAERKQ